MYPELLSSNKIFAENFVWWPQYKIFFPSEIIVVLSSPASVWIRFKIGFHLSMCSLMFTSMLCLVIVLAALSLLGFAACLFALYSLMPIVISHTSAAAVNLNLLSADFYALLLGLFIFHYKVGAVQNWLKVMHWHVNHKLVFMDILHEINNRHHRTVRNEKKN